jgi:hypothetical protein
MCLSPFEQHTKEVYITAHGSLMKLVFIWMELSVNKIFGYGLQNIHIRFKRETVTVIEFVFGLPYQVMI